MLDFIKKITILNNIKFIIFFIISAILLHNKSYNKLPTSIHAWAQSDHYTLALGFLENNFDFFHPTTYSLSHQFPPTEKLENPKGIIAVDFPILHFSVAIFMKIFNTKSPIVFRMTMLLLSFIALFFLFRTISKLKGIWHGIFICSFIMFQPIYAYYQNGFHVSAAAFSFLLIGITYLLKSNYLDKKKYFLLGLLFLTIAALMRFTQIIFVIAILCVFSYNFIKTKKLNQNIFYVFISLFVVLGYFYYNKILAAKYGTIFLNKPLITNNINDLLKQIFKQLKLYLRGFLPLIHFLSVVIIYIYFKKNRQNDNKLYNFKLWFVFSFIGVLIFNLLMSWSLSVHDYYSLDTWFPLLIIVLIYLLMFVNINNAFNTKSLIVVIFAFSMFAIAIENQYWKYKFNNREADVLINDFKESAKFLNINIPKDKKTIVICYFGWNTPMVAWNRKVHRVASNFKVQIPKIFNNNFDFIVTQNKRYNYIVLSKMPNFDQYVEKIADNGLVTIWKPKIK